MNERLLDALDEISDRHINEAATAKKRNTRLLIRAAAAIVAVVLLLGFLGLDRTATAAEMLVSPAPVREAEWPTQTDYPDEADLEAAKALVTAAGASGADLIYSVNYYEQAAEVLRQPLEDHVIQQPDPLSDHF